MHIPSELMDLFIEQNNQPYLRIATIDDCQFMGLHVKEDERDAYVKLNQLTIEQASPSNLGNVYANALAYSDWCVTVVLEHKPIAIIGVVKKPITNIPKVKYIGKVWMAATINLSSMRRSFVSQTPRVLEFLAGRYQVLHNVVGAWQDDNIRWLKFVGFEISEPIPTQNGVVIFEFSYFYDKKLREYFYDKKTLVDAG